MTTAFIFPGQGAQHVGMAKTIVENHSVAKELFERANEVLGLDLAKLCFEGPQDELDKTDFSQPALFVCSFAALEILKAEQPDVVEQCSMAAGLSLGGVHRFDLRRSDLVRRRSEDRPQTRTGHAGRG